MATSDKACDVAMDRAVILGRQAEATDDPAARFATAQLAQTYVSMARELRLGSIKSRVYSFVETPGLHAPPVPEPALLGEGGALPQPVFVGGPDPVDFDPATEG